VRRAPIPIFGQHLPFGCLARMSEKGALSRFRLESLNGRIAPNPVVPGYLAVARKQTFAHTYRAESAQMSGVGGFLPVRFQARVCSDRTFSFIARRGRKRIVSFQRGR